MCFSSTFSFLAVVPAEKANGTLFRSVAVTGDESSGAVGIFVGFENCLRGYHR